MSLVSIPLTKKRYVRCINTIKVTNKLTTQPVEHYSVYCKPYCKGYSNFLQKVLLIHKSMFCKENIQLSVNRLSWTTAFNFTVGLIRVTFLDDKKLVKLVTKMSAQHFKSKLVH